MNGDQTWLKQRSCVRDTHTEKERKKYTYICICYMNI